MALVGTRGARGWARAALLVAWTWSPPAHAAESTASAAPEMAGAGFVNNVVNNPRSWAALALSAAAVGLAALAVSAVPPQEATLAGRPWQGAPPALTWAVRGALVSTAALLGAAGVALFLVPIPARFQAAGARIQPGLGGPP